jgi:hypothetical protein
LLLSLLALGGRITSWNFFAAARSQCLKQKFLGGRDVKTETHLLTLFLVSIALCLTAAADDQGPLAAFLIEDIESVGINLNTWGASLGFESEFDGDDPRLAPLIAVIRSADQGGGHKCPNMGAIRIRMAGGGVIGLGLLPNHSEGLYGFRVYDGDVFLGAYVVQRSPFLSALEELGVPMDDPAFKE